MQDQPEYPLNLKKVRVFIRPKSTLDGFDMPPQEIDFIYGLGQSGLTPFEYELARHRAGESFEISLKKDGPHEMFGHLASVFSALRDGENEIHFHITFQGYEDASPREVIKAMAELAECGENCCGC